MKLISHEKKKTSLRPRDCTAGHINPWAHPSETRRASDWKSHQREAAGQRWLCLEHWSGLSSLCSSGKKHRGLLSVTFESSTNKGWKSAKHTFPEQRASPMALYSCVSLASCLVLWSAIWSFIGTCVWPASLATAGEGGQPDHEHTRQYAAVP